MALTILRRPVNRNDILCITNDVLARQPKQAVSPRN